MSNSMVAWLRAELDRVEQLARAAGDETWSADLSDFVEWDMVNGRRAEVGREPGARVRGTSIAVYAPSAATERARADVLHIAAHDPAAVLRRVAADRQILDQHPLKQTLALGPGLKARPVWVCRTCGGDVRDDPNAYPCSTVRLLAEGYGWEDPQ
jgi:hypothetical protein